MINDCSALFATTNLIVDCDRVNSRFLRIKTPFLYPDGSFIDVFLDTSCDLFGDCELSDLGQTATFLLNSQVDFWRTSKRKQMLEAICEVLDVREDAGVLKLTIPSGEISNVSEHVLRLGQACVRCADLVLTRRLRSVGVFREDVEEFLDASSIPYESDIALDGPFGKPVRIDFSVRRKRSPLLVQTLSANSDSAFHQASLEIFRKWSDLKEYRQRGDDFLTLIDSGAQATRDEDIKRIRQEADVIFFPQEQDQFLQAIAA